MINTNNSDGTLPNSVYLCGCGKEQAILIYTYRNETDICPL